MDKLLHQSSAFKLIKKTKNDKKWYEIEYSGRWDVDPYVSYVDEAQDVRNFFDPFRNKGSRYGFKWKYKNRKDAEKMYMLAILKW